MFDIRQSIYDDSGDHDEEREHEYINDLMDEFADSPEAQPIIEQDGSVGYAGMMLEYYFGYIGGELTRMTVPDFNEVVFDLFPRKVSTEPANGPRIIAELRAFWTFIDRQYGLPNARAILVTLNGAENRLTNKLANPGNWGIAKSITMQGIEAGYDMTTEESLAAFMEVYNANLRSQPLALPRPRLDPSSIIMLPMLPPSPLSHEERKKKRKERKRERQARKRARQ
jgi:hypothetical protein